MHQPQKIPTVFTTTEPSSQAHEWLLAGLPLRQPPPPAASSWYMPVYWKAAENDDDNIDCEDPQTKITAAVGDEISALNW